ncbi:homeobox-leucine zipper protein athb-15 [Phtheirospermum japonicum]|uniref:Homeobox-leucine zipper protein athb-15 n=1 Tax=Phtheirospermum japonicum TaxID=374723 RepID=A0A830C976_9LAMI|nr:homeobox-leucine zipper protein athb-15 [Phtheirospermum japonicum]
MGNFLAVLDSGSREGEKEIDQGFSRFWNAKLPFLVKSYSTLASHLTLRKNISASLLSHTRSDHPLCLPSISGTTTLGRLTPPLSILSSDFSQDFWSCRWMALRKYVRYTPKQVEAFERGFYHDCPKPSSMRRQQLIRECPILSHMEPKQIKVWFQNRSSILPMASADPLTRVDEKLFKGSAMTKRDAYAVISYMTCADIAVKLYRWNVQRDVTGSIIMWLILRPCLVGLGAPALTGLLNEYTENNILVNDDLETCYEKLKKLLGLTDGVECPKESVTTEFDNFSKCLDVSQRWDL